MTTPTAWFVKTKTGTAGPFSSAQLKSYADNGKLPKSALVAKNADGPWITAEQLRGLFNTNEQEPEEIRPSDLIPDAVKSSAVTVTNAVSGLSKNLISSIRSATTNLSAKVEATTNSVTNYCMEGQDPAVVTKTVERVREICTSGEEILYVAIQSKPIANFSPDCVVLSNKRFIIYRSKLLGRVTFYDCLWKDSKNVHLKENILGAEISFESQSGHIETIDYLPKSQARKIYRIGQEMEEESITLRRKMEIETLQAGADKTVINQVIAPTPQANTTSEGDIVAKLAKLKSLLENGLITESEFQEKRTKLLESI
jgi:hypothetical protein